MIGPLLAEGRTAEVFAWGDAQVLKLLRPGFPPELADREAQIVRAVHEAGVLCPATQGPVDVDGRLGVLFERVDGPSMFDAVMSDLENSERWAHTLADLHLAMHAAQVPALPSLRERLERRLRGAPGLRTRTRRSLLALLDGVPDGDAACHGDFHPANVHMASRGPVVIDWVDAARGNPLADVARTVLLVEVGRPPLDAGRLRAFDRLRPVFLRQYLDRYFQARTASPETLAVWRPIVAAARLDEKVPGERRRLLRRIRDGL